MVVVKKRNPFIDHEEFKVKIKLSAGTNMLLQQDMFRFGFIKSNEEFNVNLFVNYLLPIMYKFRKSQNDMFKAKLSKRIQNEKQINDFIELANDFYYEDHASYHNETINLRISKKNMDLFQSIFNGDFKKKSTFLRSLINQYASMKLDTREFFFFNNEYHLIEEAMNKNHSIRVILNEDEIKMMPVDILTCPINSELYVFGITEDGGKIKIRAIRLCTIYHLRMLNEEFDFKISENMNQQINDFILDLEYLQKDFKVIGG